MHAHDGVNPHILRMFEDNFSHGATNEMQNVSTDRKIPVCITVLCPEWSDSGSFAYV